MGCQQSAPVSSSHHQEEPKTILEASSHDFVYQTNVCALEYWEPLQLLGEGSISSIHLVRKRPHRVDIAYQERADIMRAAATTCTNPISTQPVNDDLWALKSIMKDHVQNDAYLLEMRREIYTMSRLRHPNIVRVKEAYERRRHIYLIMEYCQGGNLCGRTFTEPEAAAVISKIVSAVAYLHQHNVVHRGKICKASRHEWAESFS